MKSVSGPKGSANLPTGHVNDCYSQCPIRIEFLLSVEAQGNRYKSRLSDVYLSRRHLTMSVWGSDEGVSQKSCQPEERPDDARLNSPPKAANAATKMAGSASLAEAGFRAGLELSTFSINGMTECSLLVDVGS